MSVTLQIDRQAENKKMNAVQYIVQDFASNKSNTKGKFIAFLFRMASLVASRKSTKVLFFPYLVFYKFFVEWVLGVELPWSAKVGPGLRIYHGQAIVINKKVQIGSNCIIRQSTTMGNSREGEDCPVIGNNVEIGSNVCIIGAVSIGDNVIIGAGSVVIKSIPSNSVAAGNPARIIKSI
jgi:putative colanic acid biosynthesis acetyltransferase WcaB